MNFQVRIFEKRTGKQVLLQLCCRYDGSTFSDAAAVRKPMFVKPFEGLGENCR